MVMRRYRMSMGEFVFSCFNYTFMTILGFFMIIPFMAVLSISLSSPLAVNTGKVTILPVNFTLSTWEYVLSMNKLWTSFFLTVAVTVIGTVLSLFLNSLMAYPLSKMTLIPAQSFAAEEITVNAIPDKHPGDSVTISGTTTFSEVSIKILYPNGDQYNVETVKSSGGEYSYTFILSSDLPYGTYTVVAGRGDITAVTSFTVNKKPSEDKITVDPIPDKYPGDSITISGTTTFAKVNIEVLDADDNQYEKAEDVESINGAYSYMFTLPSDIAPGDYRVKVTQGNITAETSFEVKQKPPEDIITVDPISDKYPGDSVTISGTTTFDIVSIKILYPNGEDAYNVESVPSSGGKYSYTFTLSPDLPIGTYTVVAGKGDITAVTTFEVNTKKSNNANLNSIKIDGIPISDFSPSVLNYTVTVPYGSTVVPIVSATAEDSGAIIDTTQASAIAPYGTTPGDAHKAIILVTAADGFTKKTYTVAFISAQSSPTIPDTPGTQGPGDGEIIVPGEQLPLGTPEEDEIIEKIKELAEGIKGSTAAEKASIVKRFLEYRKEVLNAADTAEDPELALRRIAALIDTASVLLQNLPDGKETQNVKNSVLEALDTLNRLIGKANGTEMSEEILESIIVSVSKATGTPSVTGKEKKTLADKLVKALQSYIERQTGVAIEAGVQDSHAVADIDSATADEIIKKMDEIIRLADSFHAKLKESGIERKTGKKVTLGIIADSDSAMIKAGIPGSIFNTAGKKGIDSIEIRSETASFEIPPGFISGIGDGSNISFEISRVELSDEETAKLSEEQKKLLEKDSTVYDFNLIKDGKQISAFDKKITIRLKYDLKEGEDKDNITVLYLADDGTVKNMTGRYDEATGEVVFTTDHFSSFVVKSLKVVFSDIEETFWGKKYIESMSSKGILNGKPGGVFDPHGLVTRAEFAKMIAIAAGIVDDDAKCTFTDVPESQWYYKYVASAAKAGIITGRPDNTFAPNDNITRQEMAVMIYRALKEAPPKNTALLRSFNDWTEVSDWAVEALEAVINEEIITGKPGNIIDPKGLSTRAEAAAVIYRFFNR